MSTYLTTNLRNTYLSDGDLPTLVPTCVPTTSQHTCVHTYPPIYQKAKYRPIYQLALYLQNFSLPKELSPWGLLIDSVWLGVMDLLVVLDLLGVMLGLLPGVLSGFGGWCYCVAVRRAVVCVWLPIYRNAVSLVSSPAE